MQLTIFDLDHTLLNANISYKFGKYLHGQKQISFIVLFFCMYYYASHKLFGLSIYKVHHKIFQYLFKERPLDQIQQLVNLFLDQELDGLLNSKVIARLQSSQKAGDFTLILSSSPDFLVGPIAKLLGVTDWRASVYTTNPQGLFSSISLVMEGNEKARFLAQLVSKHGIVSDSITAFSDSYLDLPILFKAGKAVAVRPDRILQRISKKKGWEIIS